jgi:anti-sigma B factor antagonist
VSFFHIREVSAEDPQCGSDVVVLAISGELDYGASPHLRERLHDEIHAPRNHLVLDLSAVTFIDSMAIGVLVGALTRLQETGGSLRVVCVEDNPRVLRIFDIAGVANLIPLHQSRHDALSALAANPPAAMRRRVEQATAIAAAGEPLSGTRPSGLDLAHRYAHAHTARGEDRREIRLRHVDERA